MGWRQNYDKQQRDFRHVIQANYGQEEDSINDSVSKPFPSEFSIFGDAILLPMQPHISKPQ